MSERIYLFGNVSTREVRVREDEIPDDLMEGWLGLKGARACGHYLLTHFEQMQSAIWLAILPRALHYLKEYRREKVLHKVVLFATNQQPPHWGDTFTYADIIKRIILKQFAGFVQDVEIVILTGNPSAYDACFEAYNKALQPYVGQADSYYLEATGGTPACSMALYLRGLSRFGLACEPIYVPLHGDVYVSNIRDQLWQMMAEQTAVSRLQQHDFHAVAPLLTHASGYIQGLTEYARLRLLFDFDGAQYHLEQAITKGRGSRRAFAQSLRTDLLRLKDEDSTMLLREVYWNAVVCWQNGRFADFLGRVFRFQEGMIRHLLEIYYEGLDTNDKYAWRDYLRDEKHTHLVAYFKGIETDTGSPVNYKQMNRYTTLLLLKHLAENEVAADPTVPIKAQQLDEIKESLVLLERIECLASLRNKTILAHGFQGVSHEIILQAYPDGFDPLADMQTLCKTLGGVGENPFQKIADFLETELQEAS